MVCLEGGSYNQEAQARSLHSVAGNVEVSEQKGQESGFHSQVRKVKTQVHRLFFTSCERTPKHACLIHRQ